MSSRRQGKFKKRNIRKPDDLEIIVKDGFSRRRLNKSVGEFNKALKEHLKFLDEKYNLTWDKILPKRFYDESVRKRRK